MAFKSSEKQNIEGRIRGSKDPKKKIKKMGSIKLPKLSRLNSSSKRFTWQFESKIENFEVETESDGTSASSSSNPNSRLDHTLDNSTPHDPNDIKKSSSLDRKISKPSFTRMPSFRSVRILKGRPSFKSHRSLMKRQEKAKDLNVVRATCSSTLKDSKFSKEIDSLEGENKLEEISALKVCPYHHCSLYGHCHGPEVVEKKPFLRRKMLPKKIPKSKRQENEERNRVEIPSYRKLESKSVLLENDLAVGKEHIDLSSTGKSEENGLRVVGENILGGKSQNEIFSQENEVCKIFPENEDKDFAEITLGSTLEPEKISQEIESKYAGKILFGGQKQTGNVPNPELISESSISMWQLIHRKMATSLAEDHDANQVLDSNSHSDSRYNSSQSIVASDMSSDETETRKQFAVKLVREAIEKILLPEVQDQSSANQPISEQEDLEGNNSNSHEISEEESSNGGDKKKDDFSDKTAPKSWSSLKKIILLKRFVKQLERVREFKLKKVQSRLLDLDEEEAEKISLRRQAMNRKKNSEEWMLDYAIRKVVSELAPNQKKKVLLLVKAFETVAPSQDDQPIQVNSSTNKSTSHQDLESNEDSIVPLSSNSVEVTTEIEENKAQMDDNECENDSLKVRVNTVKHISMWRLIHNQMVFGLEAEPGVAHEETVADNVSTTSESDSVENEDTKIRKNFAVNLVREAIEKILLPEVQDLNEKNRDEDSGKLKVSTEETEENKSEKQKPKRWSYLKKVLILNRFVEELEKVKKFNPRKPNYLPLEPGEAFENINLRPQTVDQRRNTDEWMLDYAIRQVVSQLGPTQKEKVALLVKAFETVAPPNEKNPTIVSQPSKKFTSQDEITDIKSNFNGILVDAKNNIADEKQNKIKIWHMVYQHVVSGIAEKVVQDEEFDNKNTAVKLVQEAVDEILDDSSDSQLDSGDSITTVDDCQSLASEIITPPQGETKQSIFKQKSKNWSKLKNLLLMKRAMKALGNVKKRDPRPSGDVMTKEEVNLKSQMVDERKKAEQWMLDYAVQHIVTKLTPARKRRVAMLVEAFEAVVPLPSFRL